MNASTKNNFEGQTVLVTGAFGFIGSHLVRALVARRAVVYCLAKPGSSPWRLADCLSSLGNVRVLVCDICRRDQVKRVLEEVRPRRVFHLASLVDVQRDLQLVPSMFRVNVEGTLNLLESAAGSNVDCFIHTGTCEEYGNAQPPFEEGQREEPVSPYSASKVAATHLCATFYRTSGLPVVILRPFLTYGPGQTGSMLVPSLMEAAHKGESLRMTPGGQTRDLIYIQDIVEGFMAAATTPQAVGHIINLASSMEISVKDLAHLVMEASGRTIPVQLGAIPYRPSEIMRLVGAGSKAREILGWAPKMDLKEGLRRTWAWYREHSASKEVSGV